MSELTRESFTYHTRRTDDYDQVIYEARAAIPAMVADGWRVLGVTYQNHFINESLSGRRDTFSGVVSFQREIPNDWGGYE